MKKILHIYLHINYIYLQRMSMQNFKERLIF